MNGNVLDVVAVANPLCSVGVCRQRRVGGVPCWRAICRRCGAYTAIHTESRDAAVRLSAGHDGACVPYGVPEVLGLP